MSTTGDTPSASASSTLTSVTIKDYAPRSMVSIASSQEDAWESNFDIESTRKVNELFNSLEEFLYSEVSKACLQSQECLEWSRVFPYLSAELRASSENSANDDVLMLHGIGISPARFFHNEMIESELTVESGFAVESFFDWSKSTIDELLYNNQNVGTEWWLILSYDTKIVPENTKQKITIDFEAEGSTFTALKELIEIQNSEKGRSISKSRFVLYYRLMCVNSISEIPSDDTAIPETLCVSNTLEKRLSRNHYGEEIVAAEGTIDDCFGNDFT
ncbi:MAG: hypothetical protein SGCHY_000135 [Lobulomycetales sp.]